ncbi:MAG TPA: hypothetical protein VEI02_03910, partial [Planctomycetota bacterium]|nr:hypothetical protein [Planctomycetota bacterium]
MCRSLRFRRAASAAVLAVIAAATAACFPDGGAASTPSDADAPPPPAWNVDGRFNVAFSTLLGTPGDDQLREAIPLDDGTAWIAGQANGDGMPTTAGVLQPRYAGEDLSKRKGDGRVGGDVWLGRLAADGSRVLAGTYFGGSKQERNAYGLERARDGDLVFCTMTRSHDVKTTAGAFQPRFGGGEGDWCVARVSPDLKSLRWCTYVGGSAGEFPRAGLALDAEDRPVIVGYTKSPDFPTTEGAFRR